MTSPSAVELRPAPTSVTVLLLAAIAMLVVPVTALGAALVLPYRSPATYLVIAALHLAVVVILGRGAWPWLRATRPSSPRDAAPPLLLALGTGASLVLVLLLAAGHGIRGSALPRLVQGAPMDVDVPYLLGMGLGLLALVLALLWLGLLLWRSRAPRAGGDDAREARPAGAPSRQARPLVLRPVRPVVTAVSDGMLRRIVSPLAGVLLVVGIAASVTALLVFALGSPTERTAEPLTLVVAFAPAPAAIWAVLASLWRKDEQLGIVVASLVRMMISPLLVGAAMVLPLLLATAFPAVREGFQAHHAALIGDDGLLEAGAPLVGWVAMCALVTVVTGMVGGLAVCVGVVLPAMAVFLPQEVVGENDLSTRPEDLRANIAAVRSLALLVVMIFVFAVLIVDARVGEARFWLAMVALGVLVVLTVRIVRLQRRTPSTQGAGPDSTSTP